MSFLQKSFLRKGVKKVVLPHHQFISKIGHGTLQMFIECGTNQINDFNCDLEGKLETEIAIFVAFTIIRVKAFI